MGLIQSQEITERTIATLGEDAVEEMLHIDGHTFAHGLATGAMTAEAMQAAGCSEEAIAIGALAGALHDVGKFSPRIQQLMTESSGQKFTPGQVTLMRTHTTRGFLSLAQYLGPDVLTESSEGSVAAYTALRHHATLTPRTYQAKPLHAGICHTVQLCDVAHARLFDPNRTYRAARDGAVYTPHQIGRQIVAQFTDFPPQPQGHRVPVEELVMSWADRAAHSQDPSTLD